MHEKHPQAQQPPIPPGAPAARGQDDHARFVWSVAGQLAAGLLANPGKQHYSVKDSISLFDEVLHELHSYARIRGDFVESAHIQVATGEQGHEAQPGATLEVAPTLEPTAPVALPEPAIAIRQPAPAQIQPQYLGGAGAAVAFTPSPVQGLGMPFQSQPGAPGHNVLSAGPTLGTDRQDVSMELPDLPLPPADSSVG